MSFYGATNDGKNDDDCYYAQVFTKVLKMRGYLI